MSFLAQAKPRGGSAAPVALDAALAAFVLAAVSFEDARQSAQRIDGTIIGTGEADFTKGNQAYVLKLEDKTFQILDVPGIEGDEQKYAEFMREAIAKSHLVIYVNGTNKKPETSTAKKIASYLRYGTQVLPIVNVRGSADSYEFPEDRARLEHKGPRDALKQTEAVLREVLRPDVLIPGACVQGLLAFSSLAFEPETGLSSISPIRAEDLGRQQRNYLKAFESALEMRDFSQIGRIEEVIRQRARTFHADIVQSNKRKTIDLLADNLVVLDALLEKHRQLMADQDPAFKACRFLLRQAQDSFERELESGRVHLINVWFDELCDSADRAIATDFGDQDRVASAIRRSFDEGKASHTVNFKIELEKLVNRLNREICEALGRLHSDIQRTSFQARVSTSPDGTASMAYEYSAPDMEFGWSKAALNIGSYAAAGFSIGTFIPGVGNLVGAALGAIFGTLMSIIERMIGKDRRIRKAQTQMRAYIETLRVKAIEETRANSAEFLVSIVAEVEAVRDKEVESLHSQMMQPKAIIENQIARMREILKKLEKLPHGQL